MEFFESMDATSWMVVLSAVVVIVLVLFAKFIKGMLKLAVIAAMLGLIVYFLQQAGIIHVPCIGKQGR